MVWYILIYLFASLIIGIRILCYDKKKKRDSERTTLKQFLITLVVGPFVIAILPFIVIGNFFNDMFGKIKKRRKLKEERKFNASLGLGPDEHYLCFSMMHGAGVIKCADCGYEEEITSFTHGIMSCMIGRQCPNCHAFACEYNESKEYHTFGKAKEDFVCPKCGTIIRKKEESIFKGKNDPLFCPKCHSARLRYHMHYIT